MELLGELAGSKPNTGHKILAEMENIGLLKHTITQNIDGLHQLAGNRNVIEVHGSLRNLTCAQCMHRISSRGMIFDSEDLPPMCHCGGVLKPDVTLFGESIDHNVYFNSLQQIRNADVLLIIGTSGMVHPVNEFPETAQRHGAKLIEINLDETLFTKTCNTIFLQGSVSSVLKQLSETIDL